MSENRQLPSSIVAREFGEVNVRRVGNENEVVFTVAMEPQGLDAEGWQTGVALDGSASMRKAFGRAYDGDIPANTKAEYRSRGWLTDRHEDGRTVPMLKRVACEDAVRRGHLTATENVVEPKAREFISYLAGNLDADGGTTVVYWASGDGRNFEVLGDFTADQCKALSLTGPSRFGSGGTFLLPAMDYFVTRFADAERGMYVFVTDGGGEGGDDQARQAD
jgi:hypothetical protein